MIRKPRNARTDRLTDWRFFIQIYLVRLISFLQLRLYADYYGKKFIGLMMWPCAMSMWFLYMSQQGLRFHDVIGVYDRWTTGLRGYTSDQLTHFVSVGNCI